MQYKCSVPLLMKTPTYIKKLMSTWKGQETHYEVVGQLSYVYFLFLNI